MPRGPLVLAPAWGPLRPKPELRWVAARPALVVVVATVLAAVVGAQSTVGPPPELAPRQGQAQTAKPAAPQTPFTFHTTVGEVLVHATVLNQQHFAVTDLPENDFAVFENGVKQKIDYFASEDAPVSVGILVDNSGSMRDKRPEVNKAALNFVKASNPQDEVFVVNFNDEYYLDADFTNSIPKLEHGLDQIESRGGTALYDAIVASLDYLTQNAKNDKRVLLVVTDGDDDASRYTLEQTVRTLQAENPPLIYAIGLLDSDDTRYMKKEAERALDALSNATGGEAFYPKNLAQVDDITREVAHDIRTQYTLSYRSNQYGADYRTIKLQVKDPKQKHLIVRTRQGYFRSGSGAAVSGPGQ